MSLSFSLFQDAALTLPVSGNLVFTLAEDGSSGYISKHLWLGSVTAGRKIQVDANPGVDTIIISFADTTPASGPETTDMNLSTDGIAWEPDGDPLDTGEVEIMSEAGNAFEFYVRAKVFAGATPGNYVQLSIVVAGLREVSS